MVVNREPVVRLSLSGWARWWNLDHLRRTFARKTSTQSATLIAVGFVTVTCLAAGLDGIF